MLAQQPSLFGREAPGIASPLSRAQRTQLDEDSWIDRLPGWVRGHERLFEHLAEHVEWHACKREMYERIVDVPRLFATVPEDGHHPIFDQMAAELSRRYGRELSHITLALYRHGGDSVAWHRDREMRTLDDSIVAIASLGNPRRFGLRPAGGGRAAYITVGWGDLVVMGGACQRDWEHGVPKARHAEPRMALMFRHGAS